MIVSDEFYQGLTKEQQKIIDQAAKTAQEKARESADDRRIQRQKVLEDEGMPVSYTHLAVYKRQGLARSTLIFNYLLELYN